MSVPMIIELGCEELPGSSIQKTVNAIESNLIGGLTSAGFHFSSYKSLFTPRRITFMFDQIDAMQADQNIIRKGPALDKAFVNNQPTPQALGFAKSCGESLDNLVDQQENRLVFRFIKKGESLVDWLTQSLPKILSSLPNIQTMRWGSGDDRFPRPVHWLCVMVDHQVVPVSAFNVDSNNFSYGHRFHSPDAFKVEYNQYVEELKKRYVMISPQERKRVILEDCQNKLPSGFKLHVDDELLDEVNTLVEWPKVYLGSFDKKYLVLPDQMLISVMKNHQKCFAVKDSDGQLAPYFLGVNNIEPINESPIVADCQNVMKARLEDAYFFFQNDTKIPLIDHSKSLDSVLFHKLLGTMMDRVDRVSSLARFLDSGQHQNVDFRELYLLSKADLQTSSVFEFPELEGIIGQHIAKVQNLGTNVEDIIVSTGLPKLASDPLPTNRVAKFLSMAEKLDTVVGFILVNQMPSADKDPFAVRRSAIGFLRLCLEGDVQLNLHEAIKHSLSTFPKSYIKNNQAFEDVADFIVSRMQSWCSLRSIPLSIYHSAIAKGQSNLHDIKVRMDAANHFLILPESGALLSANKRVLNILKKAKGSVAKVDPKLLIEESEAQLWNHMVNKKSLLDKLLEKQSYIEMMTELATYRTLVDQFFDQVMVMVTDDSLRSNRIALLSDLFGQLNSVVILEKLS